MAFDAVQGNLDRVYPYVPVMRSDKGFPRDGDLSEEQWKLPYYDIFKPAHGQPVRFDVANSGIVRALERENVPQERGAFKTFDDGSRLFLSKHLTPDDGRFIAESFWGQRWGRWWSASNIWLLVALLPPIILLGFGWVVRWVSFGFREK